MLLLMAPLGRSETKTPPGWAEQMVRQVRASFPELANADIRLRQFAGQSDYFQARFSVLRFLFARRMRYFIMVNSGPETATAPAEGRRAILAHELAHVVYYAGRNRVRLVGLVRLASGAFRERFERRADAEAIRRGFAQGLKEYRLWLYLHVPGAALAEKQRDYLSPEEIDARARR